MDRPSNDICADQIERMIRGAGAVRHAGLVLASHHDDRIAELEAALRDAIPFLAVNMDKYRRDYGLTELHPTHAEIIDRISRLSGGGPLSKKLTG